MAEGLRVNQQDQVLPDGTVMCLADKAGEAAQALAPHELWKALVSPFFSSDILRLGKRETPEAAQLIHYRFSNQYDDTLQDDPHREPDERSVRDLSGDPAFQAEIRKAMDELERIGHLRFVPAPDGAPVDLAIGYASHWPERVGNLLTGGHARRAGKDGVAMISLIANTPNLPAIIRHELGHALGLSHPRNYPTQSFATRCDIGAQHDLRNQTVMSYMSTTGFYGDDDVKAIRHLYGPSRHAEPYAVPVMQQTLALGSYRGAEGAASDEVKARIHFKPNAPTELTINGRQILLPALFGEVAIVDSSSATEDTTFINPPSRIRYIHRGGNDTMRVTDSPRFVGVANDTIAQTGDILKIETVSGNTVLLAANHPQAEAARYAVTLADVSKAQLTDITVHENQLGSGHTGYFAEGVVYEITAGGRTTHIGTTSDATLSLHDHKGEPIELPPLPSAERRLRSLR